MMAEACVSGRPVYLFDTGEGRTSMKHNPWLDGVAETADAGDTDEATNDTQAAIGLNRWHLKAHVYRLTMRLGPERLTRDIRIVQRLLVDSGRAIWLGDGFPETKSRPLEDMRRAVDRVRMLFDA